MKSIKIWDGIRVTTATESEVVKSPSDLWDLFGWDIKNDPAAKECSLAITRELFCFGRVDLTEMNNGKTLFLSVVPASESEVD